jgi:hypothetical protein
MTGFGIGQNNSYVVGAVRLQFNKMIAHEPESDQYFSIAALDVEDAPADGEPDHRYENLKERLEKHVLPKMFPNGLEFSIIHGFDYLVLNANIDGHDMAIFPGTIIYVRSDNSYGAIVTSAADLIGVSMREGRLVIE